MTEAGEELSRFRRQPAVNAASYLPTVRLRSVRNPSFTMALLGIRNPPVSGWLNCPVPAGDAKPKLIMGFRDEGYVQLRLPEGLNVDYTDSMSISCVLALRDQNRERQRPAVLLAWDMAGSLALAVLTEASLQPHAHVPHGIRIRPVEFGQSPPAR